VEDACDMELFFGRTLIDRHGPWRYLLTGTLDRTSPDVLAIVQTLYLAPVPASEPRCHILLSGTPAPSGTPAILRARPLFSSSPASFGYSPARLRPSCRLRVADAFEITDMRACTAGNVRVTPSPVSLFLEVDECERCQQILRYPSLDWVFSDRPLVVPGSSCIQVPVPGCGSLFV
jgi:hypothetical protein